MSGRGTPLAIHLNLTWLPLGFLKKVVFFSKPLKTGATKLDDSSLIGTWTMAPESLIGLVEVTTKFMMPEVLLPNPLISLHLYLPASFKLTLRIFKFKLLSRGLRSLNLFNRFESLYQWTMRFLLDSRLSTVFEDSINWASSSSWYSSSYSLVVDQDSLLSEDVTLSIGHFRVTDFLFLLLLECFRLVSCWVRMLNLLI